MRIGVSAWVPSSVKKGTGSHRNRHPGNRGQASLNAHLSRIRAALEAR